VIGGPSWERHRELNCCVLPLRCRETYRFVRYRQPSPTITGRCSVYVAKMSPCFNKSVVASRLPEVYDVLEIRMKLSFLPGELDLSDEQGEFVIQVQGKEILRTRSKRTALSKFNELRRST
jgi:hypothetical protein